jgi:LuxR family quorum-sensing system transcriptional regulator SolR
MSEPDAIHASAARRALAGDTAEACFANILAEAQALGFEYCVHGTRLPVPVTRPRTCFYSNYPPQWVKRYDERRYIERDPTVRHGMRSSLPVVWSDAFFAEVPELWAEANEHGIRHGWAQSRRDAEGAYSLLVLARSGPPITPEELAAKELQLQWLVSAAHMAMQASSHDTPAAVAPPKLSAREVEVLRWTAEGKTSAEIAGIVSLSERTVNYHLSSATAKLGASNKTSAAVRAALLGLIW